MDGCRHRRWRRWLFPAECAQCGRQTFCGTPAPPCPPAAPWSDHVQPADRKGTIISLLMLHLLYRKGMTSLLVSSGISSSYSKYNVKLMRTSECLYSSKMKDDRLILNTFFFLKKKTTSFGSTCSYLIHQWSWSCMNTVHPSDVLLKRCSPYTAKGSKTTCTFY